MRAIRLFLTTSLIAVCGCALIKPVNPWCNNIPPGQYSLLCQAAHQLGQEPEAIGALIEIANIAALSSNAYTAAQANAFIDGLIIQATKYRSAGATWPQLVDYAMAKYRALPPAAQAAMIIVNQYASVQMPPELQSKLLSAYDWQGVIAELNRQKAIVAPFLK